MEFIDPHGEIIVGQLHIDDYATIWLQFVVQGHLDMWLKQIHTESSRSKSTFFFQNKAKQKLQSFLFKQSDAHLCL